MKTMKTCILSISCGLLSLVVAATSVAAETTPTYELNQRVLARVLGKYLPGDITALGGDQATVQLLNGKIETVSIGDGMIPYDWKKGSALLCRHPSDNKFTEATFMNVVARADSARVQFTRDKLLKTLYLRRCRDSRQPLVPEKQPTFFDGFAENYKRLVPHKGTAFLNTDVVKSAGNAFFHDPGLVGIYTQPDQEGYLVNIDNYRYRYPYTFVQFNADGTGTVESLPIALMKDGSVRALVDEVTVTPFAWGVWVENTAEGKPVTMLLLVFQNGYFQHWYYNRPAGQMAGEFGLSVVAWNHETGEVGQERIVYYSEKSFVRSWPQIEARIRQVLNDDYESGQNYSFWEKQFEFNIMMNMMNNMHNTSMNIINNF